jgi:hypothetical protein
LADGVTMASEQQIAANRRNARKNTGPFRRYRHGPTLSIASSAACAKQLDNLVRKITGDTEHAIVRIVSSLAGRLLQEQPSD